MALVVEYFLFSDEAKNKNYPRKPKGWLLIPHLQQDWTEDCKGISSADAWMGGWMGEWAG